MASTKLAQKYKTLITKNLKSDELDFEIDGMKNTDINAFGEVMADFVYLTRIHVYSQRCNPQIIEKYEQNLKKLEDLNSFKKDIDKVNLWKQIRPKCHDSGLDHENKKNREE